MAAGADPHVSRAKFSETITIGRIPNSSAHVKSRPATSRVPMVWKYPGET